jgi:hypothetical protein
LEAWDIPRGDIVSPTNEGKDTASFTPGTATCVNGFYTQEGEVRFFCGGRQAGILGTITNVIMNHWARSKVNAGSGMCKTSAGGLRRISYNGYDPHNPVTGFFSDVRPDARQANRNFNVDLNCCGAGCKNNNAGSETLTYDPAN